MASAIINGYGEVRIHVENDIVEPFILPIPNEKGLEEINIKESDITILEYRNTVKERIDGYRKRFTIHYDDLLQGEDCFKIASILEKEMEGHPIRIYPRNMNLMYNFLVYSSNTEPMIKILKRGTVLGGMQGLILEFTTIEVSKHFGWMDITNLNTVEEGYEA